MISLYSGAIGGAVFLVGTAIAYQSSNWLFHYTLLGAGGITFALIRLFRRRGVEAGAGDLVVHTLLIYSTISILYSAIVQLLGIKGMPLVGTLHQAGFYFSVGYGLALGCILDRFIPRR